MNLSSRAFLGAVILLAGLGGRAAGQGGPTYAFPARPAEAEGGLEGAYLRVVTSFFNGSPSTTMEGWFFTNNGRFARSPAGGVDLAALAAAPIAGRSEGVYWREGDKLHLAWARGGNPTTYTFARDGVHLKLGGLLASRGEAFARGWRLDGEYAGGGSAGGGTLAAGGTLVFRRDGTYAHSGTAVATTTGERSAVTAGASSASAGTYEFDGFTLTLRPAGGEARRFTVFAHGERDREGRPEYLYRDGVLLKRR